MIYVRANKGILRLVDDAVRTVRLYRQMRNSDNEAGGVLLGRLILDCDDVIVDEVSTPTSSDVRGRFAFFRGKSDAQRLVDEKWQQSMGTQIYLGEWHTHPESDPTPSANIDIKNWHRITNNAKFEQEFLFFIIVGTLRTRVWELNKTTYVLSELRRLSESTTNFEKNE